MTALPRICNTDGSSENPCWPGLPLESTALRETHGNCLRWLRENEFSHDSTHQTILMFSSPLLSGASSGREPENSCLKLNARFPLLAWCEHYLLPISFPSRLAYARKNHLDTVLQHPLLQGTSLCIVSPSQSFTFRLKKKNQLSPLSSFFGVISLL